MKRIQQFLNFMTDANGVINPTQCRVSDDGRSLVCDAALQPKTPIHFRVNYTLKGCNRNKPIDYSVSCPGFRMEYLSQIEMVYLYQQIIASPYIKRCDITDNSTRWLCDHTVTIIENPDPLAETRRYFPTQGAWKEHEKPIDLTQGSPDFQLAVSLKKQIRERKNRPYRFHRRGIIACLEALGFTDPNEEFYLQCVQETQTGRYYIRVRDNLRFQGQGHDPLAAEAFEMIYDGTDRNLFLRAVRELYEHYQHIADIYSGDNSYRRIQGFNIVWPCPEGSDTDIPDGTLAIWLAEATGQPEPVMKPREPMEIPEVWDKAKAEKAYTDWWIETHEPSFRAYFETHPIELRKLCVALREAGLELQARENAKT